MRDEPMGIRCILRIYYSIESKWDHPHSILSKQSRKTPTTLKTCSFLEPPLYLSLRSPYDAQSLMGM